MEYEPILAPFQGVWAISFKDNNRVKSRIRIRIK
jgi:hypothetical protein